MDFHDRFREPVDAVDLFQQASRDAPIARLYLPAHAIDLGLAGDQTIFQSLGCSLNGGGGILQFKCTIGTDLVLMSLHE